VSRIETLNHGTTSGWAQIAQLSCVNLTANNLASLIPVA